MVKSISNIAKEQIAEKGNCYSVCPLLLEAEAGPDALIPVRDSLFKRIEIPFSHVHSILVLVAGSILGV